MVFILPTTRVQRGWRVRPPAWTTWRRRRRRSPRTSSRPTPTAKTSRTWTAAVMNPDVSQRLKRMLQCHQTRHSQGRSWIHQHIYSWCDQPCSHRVGFTFALMGKGAAPERESHLEARKLCHRSQAASFTKSSRQLQRGRTPTNSKLPGK